MINNVILVVMFAKQNPHETRKHDNKPQSDQGKNSEYTYIQKKRTGGGKTPKN